MPRLPEPYALRDWKQVARDFDALAFDFERSGEHLPLIWWVDLEGRAVPRTFGMKAYVGDDRQGGRVFDTITCLGSVLGATLVGIDKSAQNGVDWVRMTQGYYHPDYRLYLNNLDGETGHTYWYEMLPSMLFYQIFSRYPGAEGAEGQFRAAADRWREASVSLGGGSGPMALPDFDHTAFDFKTMRPFDNGIWKEADAAAGIAWIQYMAYAHTGDPKYLEAATWALEWLDQRGKSPYYECLMPYGAYVAARSNAEMGTDYDLSKLINWCFDGDNWRRWGVNDRRWGDYDCAGLASMVADNQGYAYAMNTFILVGQLTPIARYDTRYASAIGKWILNVANAARFFYASGVPDTHQSCHEWSNTYDADSCIAYEGLREKGFVSQRLTRDLKTVLGSIKSGNIDKTMRADQRYLVLEESSHGDYDSLEHIWEMKLKPGLTHHFNVIAHVAGGGDGEGFRFLLADSPEGPYSELFTVTKNQDTPVWTQITPTGDTIYVKVEDTNRSPGSNLPDRLYIDLICVDTRIDLSPYAMGDPLLRGWALTDLGLYGSAFAGMLGAIVDSTDVDRILQLDLLATESFKDQAYPTYLYYNPYDEDKTIQIETGSIPVDLYDAVIGSFIRQGVSGLVNITIPAGRSVVLVHCPQGGTRADNNGKLRIDGVVIDYRFTKK